jgi:hypothetical protein
MSYISTIGPNYELELHDDICEQLNIHVGDILSFEVSETKHAILAKKHNNQSLTDEEISKANNLARVVVLARSQ